MSAEEALADILVNGDCLTASEAPDFIEELALRGYMLARLTAPVACPDTAGGRAPDGWKPTYGIVDPDYARVFTIARTLAWQEGYAVLFHGSFTRDLDLIAVPWTDAACEPEHLVRRIAGSLEDMEILVKTSGDASQSSVKPHGRLAWTLIFKSFGDPRFVDFSVMPPAAPTPPAETGNKD